MKLTQKEKLMQAHLFATSVKHLAQRLEYDCKDFNFKTGLKTAEDLKSEVDEFLKKLK